MIIKLDLEKAYDIMEWDFIMDCFLCLGIPLELRNLLFHCISSISMQVNLNALATKRFNSSRGLRQGDPISPYLFVLGLERVGHKIKDEVAAGNWQPFSFGRGDSPKLSHMCFADDLILVVEASQNQVSCINSVLNMFCEKSGQKISLLKSQIFLQQY